MVSSRLYYVATIAPRASRRPVKTEGGSRRLLGGSTTPLGSVRERLARVESGRSALASVPADAGPLRASTAPGRKSLLLDAVPEETLGIDRVESEPPLQLLAQLADMALDHVLVDILVEQPVDRAENLRLGDAPAATLQ